MLSRLFRAFEHYADGLDECRKAVRDSSHWKREFPGLHQKIQSACDQSVREIAYYYRAAKRSLVGARPAGYRSNPANSSIEYLERMFIRLRDETAREWKESRRFYTGKQREEASRSSKRAKALAKLTRDAALTLVSELKARGVWTVRLQKELGLERWVD